VEASVHPSTPLKAGLQQGAHPAVGLRGKFSAKLRKCQGSVIDDVADGTVNTFDEALGHSVVKVVEELVPPVAQSVGKPDQVATSRDSDLPYSSRQK